MTESPALVFVDSNVVFSASRSEASPLLRLWRVRHLELLTSEHSVTEIRSHYESPDHEMRAEALIAAMRKVSDRPDLQLPSGIVLPAKDAPIYLAALAAGASYLITGDKKHFGPYFDRRHMGLTVMLPMAFLKLLAK